MNWWAPIRMYYIKYPTYAVAYCLSEIRVMDKCIFVFVFFFGLFIYLALLDLILYQSCTCSMCVLAMKIFSSTIHASISIIHGQNKFLTEPCYLFIEIKAHWSSSKHDECYMLYSKYRHVKCTTHMSCVKKVIQTSSQKAYILAWYIRRNPGWIDFYRIHEKN